MWIVFEVLLPFTQFGDTTTSSTAERYSVLKVSKLGQLASTFRVEYKRQQLQREQIHHILSVQFILQPVAQRWSKQWVSKLCKLSVVNHHNGKHPPERTRFRFCIQKCVQTLLLILFWGPELNTQPPQYHYSLYSRTDRARRIQESVWLSGLSAVMDALRVDSQTKTADGLPTLSSSHHSPSRMKKKTFGSNTIPCLVLPKVSKNDFWERREKCCVSPGEKSVWSAVSAQVCSRGWWFTFSRLISISTSSGLTGSWFWLFFLTRFSCLLRWN